MGNYTVKNPWHGVKKGQVIESDSLHPSVKSHVEDRGGDERKLEVATPKKQDDESKSGKAVKSDKDKKAKNDK